MRRELVCSLCLCAFVVNALLAGDRIPFSMHEAPAVVSQSQKSRPAFSMHAAEEVTPTKGQRIAFSVHDAKALTGEVNTKPDCAPARTVNRVLVIAPAKQTIRVKVCDDFGCRFELRTLPHPILTELKKLAPKWSFGDKECDHFRFINADDPKQADLIRELQIKREDLPLLVKETEVEKRKRAAGMSAEDIAKQWNKWFVEPEAEKTGTAEGGHPTKCLPGFGTSSSQWTWPGDIRDHLTDPRQAHHLPRAVVDTWTDQQCIAWHNWHHETLRGKKVVKTSAVQSRSPQPVARSLSARIDQIARSVVRSPPPQMVAAARASYGNSSDAKKAKKKRSTLSRNGSLTSESVCGVRLLAGSSPSIPYHCSTRSRSFPS